MYKVTSKSLGRPFLKTYQSYRHISYKLPTISVLENLKLSKENFNGLYSNKTIDELWFKRGQQLIDGLNQSLEDNQLKNPPSDLNDLIAITINKPELFGVYSYASLLHNLQFSLESLKPNDSEFAESLIKKGVPEDLLQTPSSDLGNEPVDENLRSWIIDSFGSIDEFRTLLLNSGKAIKGDGLVWLVAESSLSENTLRNTSSNQTKKEPTYNNLSIINSYNAGIVDDSIRSGQITKLKQQKHARIASLKKKQEERKNIENNEAAVNQIIEEITELEEEINDLVLGTVEEAESNTLFSDKKLLPLLSIDVSLRNYLLDYGIFGRQQYLDNTWKCIDWDVVSKRLPPRSKQFVKFD